MCNFKTLHFNEHGYVVQCEDCSRFQLAFGNIAVSQTGDEFREFTRLVAHKYGDKTYSGCLHRKDIYLETAARNLMLVFTPTELKNLNDLLQQAELSVELNKLLKSAEQDD